MSHNNYKIIKRTNSGYIVRGNSGTNLHFNEEQIIDMLKSNFIKVDGLELIEESHLINTAMLNDKRIVRYKLLDNTKNTKVEPEEKLTKLINKITLLGGEVKEIETPCNHLVYLLKLNKSNILYIPENVTHPLNATRKSKLREELLILRGDLRVVGGKNIVYMNRMFEHCILDTLDLRELHFDNVEMMQEMFKASVIKQIIFGEKQKQSKVIDMTQMFYMFRGNVDRINIDTSNVKYMTSMFEMCEINELNLNNFDISNLLDIRSIFFNSTINKLNIEKLEFSKRVRCMNFEYMSRYSKIKELNINNKDKELWDLGYEP